MKLIKYWFLSVVFSLSLLQPDLVLAKHPLQNAIDKLQTFSADFVQETEEDGHVFRTQRSFGTFDLQRPGKMRWDYHQPNEQHLILDGEHLWVHDLDLKQVSLYKLADIQNDIPLAWLLFNDAIEDTYRILDAGEKNGLTWYNLKPKKATFFHSVEIGVKNQTIHQVWMYQDANNLTKIRFEDIRENEPISDRAFQFTPPAGTDLIGEM